MRHLAYPLTVAIALFSTACTSKAEPTKGAEALFNNYQLLGLAYDPAIVNLYCDNAQIRYTRTYPDGRTMVLEMQGSQIKQQIPAILPVAKARGDYDTFSNVTYTPEGDNVRITATRYSALKKKSNAFSMVVSKCKGRDWGILEEVGESQP